MARYTDEQKAQAVARVKTGDNTIEQIAKDVGCTDSTLRRWVSEVSAEITDEKTVAERVAEITEQIEQKQVETRKALLDRIEQLVPQAKSLKDVATAYGILTDKMLVAQGKPTTIQGQAVAVGDGSTEDLEKLANELKNRRERSGAATS